LRNADISPAEAAGTVPPKGMFGDMPAPLLRLKQIAEELRAAALKNDLEVVCAAARMLGPTMRQCTEWREANPAVGHPAVTTARQIGELLDECEGILIRARRSVADEMKRIRTGRRALAMARARVPVRSRVAELRRDG
jgi:hypothetical protein